MTELSPDLEFKQLLFSLDGSVPYINTIQAKKLADLWGLELSRDLYVMFAEASFKEGKLRESIENYRDALHYDQSLMERSQIYLELCRIYRIQVQMKSARIEIQRAFEAFKMSYPKNSFYRFLKSFALFTLHLLVTRTSRYQKNPTLEHKVDLYEEAGLSSYYLQHKFSMLQCMFDVRRLVTLLGPGEHKLNWYGGTSVVFATLRVKKLAQWAWNQMQEICDIHNDSRLNSKKHIWMAIGANYIDMPKQSTEFFSKALEQPDQLNIRDYEISSTTFIMNLSIRGHMKAALDFYTEQTSSKSPIHEKYIDLDIHIIPALSYFNKTSEINHIINNNKSIYSYSDEETWAIAHYLGNLLWHYQFQNDLTNPNIEASIERFYTLKLKPSKTHYEACHFWVAKACIDFKRAQEGLVNPKVFKKSLRELDSTTTHPVFQAYSYMLKALQCRQTEDLKNYNYYANESKKLSDQHDIIITKEWLL